MGHVIDELNDRRMDRVLETQRAILDALLRIELLLKAHAPKVVNLGR